MSFNNVIKEFEGFDFPAFFETVTDSDVERVLGKEKLNNMDFLILLSEKAAKFLEPMARKSHQVTVQYFGRTIHLFVPLYISNFCSNECTYCGFNIKNSIKRRKLSLEEVEAEAVAIAKTGIQHLLLLTGEAHQVTPVSYLVDVVKCLKKHFASVSIEIFPMDECDYRSLKAVGVDGLTVFQEVYDKKIYKSVHLSGQKSDYLYRLNAPERGAKAGYRNVNIGCLMGLGEPRSEAFFTGMHGRYLEDNYLHTEVSLSLPRFNPAEGDFVPPFTVNDKTFVQFLCAFRLFLPRAGISVSTRESALFRDNLISLGVTRYSAGSCTGVGGYAVEDHSQTPQFEITDERSVEDVVAAIVRHGYQPVYKDWDQIA
ncbi:MAG: 2-iminoacetate synthase ThiH [Desulfotalea sp.]|nr:MAG: 2-iminoacetate synthase ThiH [Desulfotalea sp.]